ncbi:sulfite exporter TauE/SafE family protein [Solitalea canadensis]|uniref:Probable membrane transporter protein n=1 Tax=Solitalea canadensis (strain ATCC 29591 / DSM 3403 / JCM 21819 / LMG 8368 / NBRC 15130 / NCIMB 12057 / USAM 9D) TaxID=929556 RepID=H8KXD2_SOLCM|nr:sulfite exporter TauE/SafE family protein [Solitalea canadensis]AFD08461.1 putative permease [Solitalea canadensis DSM 3403]
MEIIGYLGAIIMGLTLGLIGGGGSILTVPILVYLFHVDTVQATAYSLFIVGLTSMVGSVSHFKQNNIDWRSVLLFGVPSVLSVFITRTYLVKLIPETVVSWGDVTVNKSLFLLLVFAVVMLFAAFSMIKKPKYQTIENQQPEPNNTLLIAQGLFVGEVTGLVGAGGGFLIIPALVIMANLPIKKAIGTSLVIIVLNSLIGFLSNHVGVQPSDWSFMLKFFGIASVGILIGSGLSKKISGENLKPAFGWFVLIMGSFIIIKELLIK